MTKYGFAWCYFIRCLYQWEDLGLVWFNISARLHLGNDYGHAFKKTTLTVVFSLNTFYLIAMKGHCCSLHLVIRSFFLNLKWLMLLYFLRGHRKDTVLVAGLEWSWSPVCVVTQTVHSFSFTVLVVETSWWTIVGGIKVTEGVNAQIYTMTFLVL